MAKVAEGQCERFEWDMKCSVRSWLCMLLRWPKVSAPHVEHRTRTVERDEAKHRSKPQRGTVALV